MRRLKPDEEMNPQTAPVLTHEGSSGAAKDSQGGIMNLKKSFYQSAVSVKEFGERMGHHAFPRLFCVPVIFAGKIMLAISMRFTIADLYR
jgi:hypothetical protein